MTKDHQLVKSELDVSGPIDFEKLRDATQTIGPLRMSLPGHPYIIEVTVYPCPCEAGCDEQVVSVVRRNGVFAIRWILSQQQLEAYNSLDELRLHVLAGMLDNTSAERQFIENQIEDAFGAHYTEINKVTCYCGSCIEARRDEELWRHMILAQLGLGLSHRDSFLEEAKKAFGEDGEDFVSSSFDLGYLVGRIFSEYQFKEGIEAHAIAGMDFEELKTKRAHKAGETSAGKRTERVAALLRHMELLAEGSPAVLRIGPLALAKMAGQDASAENPALWSQGLGQVEEYLGLIRRGEAEDGLQARYLALFPPKPRRH